MKNCLRRIVGLIMVLALTLSASCASADGSKSWTNILLLGSDSRSEEAAGRTDTMIILSINAEAGKICMTSLMRDTWAPISGLDRYDKLNAANVYGGPQMAIDTINDCFGMDIEDYVLVGMQGLADIIDGLGGIDVALTRAEASYINEKMGVGSKQTDALEEGESVHLNGEQAMWYARTRAIDNDYQRTERQRKVLVALAGKLKQCSIFELMGLAGTMLEKVDTSLTAGEVIRLGIAALDIDLEAVRQLRLPQDGTYESGKMENGLWTIRPDFEKNREILYRFLYEDEE